MNKYLLSDVLENILLCAVFVDSHSELPIHALRLPRPSIPRNCLVELNVAHNFAPKQRRQSAMPHFIVRSGGRKAADGNVARSFWPASRVRCEVRRRIKEHKKKNQMGEERAPKLTPYGRLRASVVNKTMKAVFINK